jgi:hypothetical protein
MELAYLWPADYKCPIGEATVTKRGLRERGESHARAHTRTNGNGPEATCTHEAPKFACYKFDPTRPTTP